VSSWAWILAPLGFNPCGPPIGCLPFATVPAPFCAIGPRNVSGHGFSRAENALTKGILAPVRIGACLTRCQETCIRPRPERYREEL